MGSVNFDTHCDPARSGVNRGRDRTERFGKHNVSTTVEESDNLTVARYWHRRNRVLSRQFEKFDTHLYAELTAAGGDDSVIEFRVEVLWQDRHASVTIARRGVGSRG